MKTFLLLVLALAPAPLARADEPLPPSPQGNDGLAWVQPSPVPPVVAGHAVRGALAAPLHAHEPTSGELRGLRVVTLREGSGTIVLLGETRHVRPGDRVGSSIVKGVGADRLILERAARAAGGSGAPSQEAATIVVTFGPGGVARVRTYLLPGSTVPPPEIR